MKIKNFVKIDNASNVEEDDGIVKFKTPLAITDNSTQWNNTHYDIDSLRIDEYDGIVTQDHGTKIEDVIGKVINLKKSGNKVLIDAIKFAVKENPAAVLAKNLLKSGFVTGFSIETIGGDPDETNTWRNHSLCGLSLVAHPNNKNAYATVANSIKECKENGFKAEDVIKSIYFFDDVLYNKNINNRKENMKIINWNPWHDEKGLFTDGAGSAFGGTVQPIGDFNQSTDSGIIKSIEATYHLGGDNRSSYGKLILDGVTTKTGITGRRVAEEVQAVSKSITPEVAQTVDCVTRRAYDMKNKDAYYSGANKATKQLETSINSLVDKASKGELTPQDKQGTKDIENMTSRKGSYLEQVKPLMKQIRAMDNTMKYVKENVKGRDLSSDIEKGSFQNYNFYTRGNNSFSNPNYKNVNSDIKKINDGDVFTREEKRNESETQVAYYTQKDKYSVEAGKVSFKDGKTSYIALDVNKYGSDRAGQAAVKAGLEDALKNL